MASRKSTNPGLQMGGALNSAVANYNAFHITKLKKYIHRWFFLVIDLMVIVILWVELC